MKAPYCEKCNDFILFSNINNWTCKKCDGDIISKKIRNNHEYFSYFKQAESIINNIEKKWKQK